MRFPCEIVFVRSAASTRGISKPTKASRGFVVVSKDRHKTGKGSYQVQFALQTDKNGNKFSLETPPQLITNLWKTGKMTLIFPTHPATTVMISKAEPDSIKNLIELITKIASGEEVELENSKVKTSDFKPKCITIDDSCLYEKSVKQFSEFLKSLTIRPIGMRRADTRWNLCKNLTHLILSGNPIGAAPNCRSLLVISEFRQLISLDLAAAHLDNVPADIRLSLFKKLSPTLQKLNVEDNNLEKFPPIFHLTQLKVLNVGKNRITYLPSRIGNFRHLERLDICQNQLTWLPAVFTHFLNIQHISLSSNDSVIRFPNEINQPLYKRLEHKHGEMQYSHKKVDTLKTIAANAIHRRPELMIAAKHILPLCLRLQVHDCTFEAPNSTSMELCCGCFKLRHIRFVKTSLMDTRSIANSVDVFDRYVILITTLCIDCFVKPLNDIRIPTDRTFFRGSI